MVPGFNHNVQHRGKTYHIQTEDSGRDNPHIITLLYLEGIIVAKKKTSYMELARSENLTNVVTELMQEQHKAMLRDLVRGGFDHLVPGGAQTPAAVPTPTPHQPAAPAPTSAPPVSMTAAPVPAPAVQRPVQVSTVNTAELSALFSAGQNEEVEKGLDEIILSYLSDENT